MQRRKKLYFDRVANAGMKYSFHRRSQTSNDQLTATNHFSYILTACTSLLYALHVLRCHGIADQSLKDVFQATVLAKTNLLLASVVWALYSSWLYKTQLLSETVYEARVLFLQRSIDYIIHCQWRRGHSFQKHPQKCSTCIAALSGRATSTAQPQKLTWN